MKQQYLTVFNKRHIPEKQQAIAYAAFSRWLVLELVILDPLLALMTKICWRSFGSSFSPSFRQPPIKVVLGEVLVFFPILLSTV
jgi:hypothetical protein